MLNDPPVRVQVCGQEEGDGTFDECSWCHRQVHLACHDPVLPEKPGMQDSWYCSCCKDTVHKRNAARGVIARRTLRSMKNGNTPEAAAPQASNPSAKNGKVQDLEALLAGGTPELTTTALAGSSKRGATSRGTAGASNSKVYTQNFDMNLSNVYAEVSHSLLNPCWLVKLARSSCTHNVSFPVLN